MTVSLLSRYEHTFFGPTVTILYEGFHGEVWTEEWPAALAVYVLEQDPERGKTISGARILWGEILDHWSFSV